MTNKIPTPLAGESAAQYHQRLIAAGFAAESTPTSTAGAIDDNARLQQLQDQFLSLVPESATIGNITLRERLTALDPVWATEVFLTIKQRLIDLGLLRLGRGRGGSVSRTVPENTGEPDNAVELTTVKAMSTAELSSSIRAALEKGFASFKAGDYQGAIREWEALATRGVAPAQYNLALLYHNGRGVTKDYERALKWYGRAAELGHAKAQFYLGGMYEAGTGVPQDMTQAATWYRKSAEAGNADAQLALGLGLTLDDDPGRKQALKWIQKAAEQGKAKAQHELANLYRGGWGGKKKADAEALEWTRKAAEQGYADAESILGTAYLNGGDEKEGVRWLSRAVEHGDVDAAYFLGWAHDPENEESTLEKSNEEAAKWYRLAASHGELNSFESLEAIYTSGGYLPKSLAKAAQWLQSAAEDGDVVAQYMLAVKYEEGEGVRQDLAQAARWYEAAAEQYCPWAQLRIGYFYENGISVSQNYEDAMYWYTRAIEQNTPSLRAKTVQGNVQSEAARCLMDLNARLGKTIPPELAKYVGSGNHYSIPLDNTDEDESTDESAEPSSPPQVGVSPGRPMDMPWKLPTDWKDALSWSCIDRPDNGHVIKLRTGAESGGSDCQNLLGILYLTGTGVPFNMIAGQALFELAAANGNQDAAENLAMSLDGGVKAAGVEKLAKQMNKPGKFIAALDKFVADRETRRKSRKSKE